MSPLDRSWLQGYAAALAELVRLYDLSTVAKEIVVGGGLTLKEFEQAGVTEYDLLVLKKVLT